MYKIGDKVLHQREGACYITEIVNYQTEHEPKQYYLLESVIDQNSTIYVSTQKHDQIRKVISLDTLRQSESKIKAEYHQWPADSKERKLEMHKSIGAFNFTDALQIFSRLILESQKSKLPVSDEHFLKLSEKLVCSEIAIILNKSYQYVKAEVPKYIINKGMAVV